MKKFMFTSNEIDEHTFDGNDWHDFVRRREAEIAFSLFKDMSFDNALELGAGNGGQSITIAKHCKKLVCTEKNKGSLAWLGTPFLQRKLPNVTYMLCDAQDLSEFNDRSFDLIFSSNMLEHIPDINKCLNECRRVLTDDGVMLHFMPNRLWKLCHTIFSILRFNLPHIHGISKNHITEFYVFGASVWKKLIESNGFKVIDIIGMPFYIGHGNRFVPVIKAGNALQMPATFLYIIKKDMTIE